MSPLRHIEMQRARLLVQIQVARGRLRADAGQLGTDAGMAMLGFAAGKVLARRPWLAALAGAAAFAFKVLRRR